MVYYKYRQFLVRREGIEFDDVLEPEQVAPLSGVYRCEHCGTSIVGLNGQPLPGTDHHLHEDREPILWRLIVSSHHK